MATSNAQSPNSRDWHYETVRMRATQDIAGTLDHYRQNGYQVLHRHYVPGDSYQFLVARPKR